MAKNKPIAFVVRHGSTLLNAQKCFRSWINAPLDAEGKVQAHEAADWLHDNAHLDEVWSSPLDRAVETARICTDLPINQHSGLLGWHLGVFGGVARDMAQGAMELFIDNPHVAIPNGESLDSLEQRVADFVEPLLKDAEERGVTLGLFTHNSTLMAMDTLFKGMRDQHPELGSVVETGGIACVFAEGDGYRLEACFKQTEQPQLS